MEQVYQTQNPLVPPIAKLRIAREKVYLKMDDMAEALRMYPYTKDELEALAIRELIDQGIDPGSIFRPGIDLDTFIVVISEAKESKLRTKILDSVVSIKLQEGNSMQQNQVMQPQPGGVEEDQSKMNSVFNQQISADIADQRMEERQPSFNPNE